MWQDRPCRFAVSQGYYAVALRAAQSLGVEIPEAYIQSAEQAYRSYYIDDGDERPYFHTFPDNTLGPDGSPVGILSVVDFEPEFLSLYLFDSLSEVREATHWWMIDYNETRPHDALGDMTPAAFMAKGAGNSTLELSP